MIRTVWSPVGTETLTTAAVVAVAASRGTKKMPKNTLSSRYHVEKKENKV